MKGVLSTYQKTAGTFPKVDVNSGDGKYVVPFFISFRRFSRVLSSLFHPWSVGRLPEFQALFALIFWSVYPLTMDNHPATNWANLRPPASPLKVSAKSTGPGSCFTTFLVFHWAYHCIKSNWFYLSVQRWILIIHKDTWLKILITRYQYPDLSWGKRTMP